MNNVHILNIHIILFLILIFGFKKKKKDKKWKYWNVNIFARQQNKTKKNRLIMYPLSIFTLNFARLREKIAKRAKRWKTFSIFK